MRDNNLPSPEGKQCVNTSRAYTGPEHPDTVHTCLIQIYFGTTKSQCVFSNIIFLRQKYQRREAENNLKKQAQEESCHVLRFNFTKEF